MSECAEQQVGTSWVVHVHGGLAIHKGGTFSAEPGVDPVKDIERHIKILRIRLGRMEGWLAAQETKP